jgi:hypothetical protein
MNIEKVYQAIPEVLSEEELIQYKQIKSKLKTISQTVHQAYLEMWECVDTIREQRLYREEYKSFDEFCQQELGADNSQVFRNLRDVSFKRGILNNGVDDVERESLLNLKESNTRFIRRLPANVQESFWKVAYGIGLSVLPKREDGSIEMTTSFLENVASGIDELNTQQGITINGEFVPVEAIQESAEIYGVPEETAKKLFLGAYVEEGYIENVKRQRQHIKDKVTQTDYIYITGKVKLEIIDGKITPIIVDREGVKHFIEEIIKPYSEKEIVLSVKSFVRDNLSVR